jgi:arsenate reductase
MSKVTIWHNPRCSKSRNSANLLEEQGVDAEVFKYLNADLTVAQVTELLEMLGMQPRELMRKSEAIYRELNLKEENDDSKLIEAMVANPKLIERPIVIKDGKAVIGRPIENVVELLAK